MKHSEDHSCVRLQTQSIDIHRVSSCLKKNLKVESRWTCVTSYAGANDKCWRYDCRNNTCKTV